MSASAADATETPGAALAARIDAEGPVSLHDYMAVANTAYYAGRDPLGVAGDFVTAPEISQMFGEMIGLALADVWARAGRPADAVYVELGPGRGTLAADALRAMATAGLRPACHLVETSPALRKAQAHAVPGACFHDVTDSLPVDRPLLIVANEFFDALPIRQFVATDAGWRERVLVNDRAEPGRRFLARLGERDAGDAVPPALRDRPQGSVVETCPAATAIMQALAARLVVQGGVMLAIDYGYAGPATGDSFQAVAAHRYADPLVDPGTRDLTAHVDFGALADAAVRGGAAASGVIGQGAFLLSLGIRQRAEALASRHPDQAETVRIAFDRLTGDKAMGQLFKVLAVRSPGWPEAEGLR